MLTRPVLLVAALLYSTPAFASKLIRGPFIQQTRPDSALIVLKTDAAAAVEVKTSGGGAKSQGTSHVLALSGLAPASDVTYQVLLDGAPAASGQFRTPGVPKTEAARHAVIGVIGDMGSGGDNERANVLQMKSRGVEAVLTVGDNAYPNGAPEDWDPKFFAPFAPLLPQTSLWPALGDHEYLTPYAKGYLDAFELPSGPNGERHYAFDWGDLHIVSLDSNCVDPVDAATSGCDGAKMVDWLRADLKASSAPWKIVTLHRPALATGKYGSSEKVASALIPTFEELGVDLVLQGHNHFYERSWPTLGGTPTQKSYEKSGAPVYVTTGGGGDWIYDSVIPIADWTAFRATAYQHLILTLASGTLKIESIRPDGSSLDSFTLVKDVPTANPDPAPETQTLSVPRAASKPSIDGELGEFSSAESVSVAAGTATASFRMLWDEEHLYLAADVADPLLWNHASGLDAELWDSDSVELLLDPDRNRSSVPDAGDRHLIVSALGDVLDAAGAGAGEDRSFSMGVQISVKRDGTSNDTGEDGGYRVEVAIPWSAIGVSATPGLRLGADLGLNDANASGTLHADWAKLASFAKPDQWNTLELMASSDPGIDGGIGGGGGAGAGRGPMPAPNDRSALQEDSASGCGCRVGGGGLAGGWLLLAALSFAASARARLRSGGSAPAGDRCAQRGSFRDFRRGRARARSERRAA